jgi:hypothetical protein
MRESCTSGSVRGASSDRRLYSTLFRPSDDGSVKVVSLSRFEPPSDFAELRST